MCLALPVSPVLLRACPLASMLATSPLRTMVFAQTVLLMHLSLSVALCQT